ncbi:MAG TPA: shikimate dehydrogenase [Acidimicrobiia bacterium]|nr:shikimate dehydrogenase [Acidimicrobiia bacterium]
MSLFYRFALLGDPVSHSRSPAIHRAALRLTDLEGDYVALRADERILVDAVEQLRSGSLDGINVTMPLKGAAFEIADRRTPLAELARSVNTLYRSEAGVEGDSTDAAAFAAIVEEGDFRRAEEFLVLGAGGSAAAALAALEGRKVWVSARNAERAQALAGRLGASGVIPWGQALRGSVLINATPLGMAANSLPEGLLEVSIGLIDLPYGSSPTPAVEAARAAGLPVVDGIEFLTRQAVLSFQRWTGRSVDFERLAEAVRGSP